MEVVVEETTGDLGEVLGMREQTGLLWAEPAIGCLAIILEEATMEVEALEAVSSVERGGTKPMTVQTKEEEVVGETLVEVVLAGVEEEGEVEDVTVMLRLLNSRGTSCSRMGTFPLGDGMEVEVVEEEEEANIREVVEEEVAGIKAMEVNMTDLVEVMEEVEMVFQA